MQRVYGAEGRQHRLVGFLHGSHDKQQSANSLSLHPHRENQQQVRMVLKKPSGEVACLPYAWVTRTPDPLSIFLRQRVFELLSFWGKKRVDRLVEIPALEHAGDLEVLLHRAKQDSHAPGWDEPADILADRRPERLK